MVKVPCLLPEAVYADDAIRNKVRSAVEDRAELFIVLYVERGGSIFVKHMDGDRHKQMLVFF